MTLPVSKNRGTDTNTGNLSGNRINRAGLD
jgi:hypothetical protein